MSGWVGLDRFLDTDPRDVGCAETTALLDVYVELTLTKAEPERRYPGLAAHLRACAPCRQDFDGLLAAAGASAP
jgi:hypothetical protein